MFKPMTAGICGLAAASVMLFSGCSGQEPANQNGQTNASPAGDRAAEQTADSVATPQATSERPSQAQSRPQSSSQRESEDSFQRVNRAGSVDLAATYDLGGLRIPESEIHTLLPRDAIPALTDPPRQQARRANWLDDAARMMVITVGDETLGVALRILDRHEIVNTTLGGEPVAITYCPLCDSATVFSRRFVDPDDPSGSVELTFGVSGALYNSNVLMYDHQDRGLWSQLAMRSVSGPMVGTPLRMLPFEIVPFGELKRANPGMEIVSDQTGHGRDYTTDPYASFFTSDRLLVPVRGIGDALPGKTLGVGVATDDAAWFVPIELSREGYRLETPKGVVRIEATDAGVRIGTLPEGVRGAQTFYYSWSAFYPDTVVVEE